MFARDPQQRYSAVLASGAGYPQPNERHQRNNLSTARATSPKRRAESTREASLICCKCPGALARTSDNIHKTTYPVMPSRRRAQAEQTYSEHARDTREWERANHNMAVHCGGLAVRVCSTVGHCPKCPSWRCRRSGLRQRRSAECMPPGVESYSENKKR